MPRAEERGKAAAGASARSGEASEGALALMVAGLIGRIEGSELMRRSPAQCTPEEQTRLVHALTALTGLRQSQQSLPALTDVDMAVVEEVWPELAALLSSSGGRSARRASAPQQESTGNGKATTGAATRTGAPATPTNRSSLTNATTRTAAPASTAPKRRSPTARPASPTTTSPVSDTAEQAVEDAAESASGDEPASQVTAKAESTAQLPASVPGAGRDLRDAVHAVLRADRRPWSGARIATQIQERDPGVTREEVYDTLYRHAELFHKTNRGWELVSR